MIWVEHALAVVGLGTTVSWGSWFLIGWLDRREAARLMDDYRRRTSELDRSPAR